MQISEQFKMSTSQKDYYFICKAQEIAQKSPCKMQHGAVAVSNGKIIGRGYNDYQTNDSSDLSNACTCHAEMAAIKDALRNSGYYQKYIHVLKDKKLEKTFKKLKLYIVRTDDKYNLKESSPCEDCAKIIKTLNIKKVYYTTNNGVNIITDIQNFCTGHKTVANRK